MVFNHCHFLLKCNVHHVRAGRSMPKNQDIYVCQSHVRGIHIILDRQQYFIMVILYLVDEREKRDVVDL